MSLNSTPRTFVTGEIETAAIFNAELRDALIALQAAWTAFTPVVANMTIGNGTVAMRYCRIGKTILLQFKMAAGTTTTYTASPVGLSLPVTANLTFGEQVGPVKIFTGAANIMGITDLLSATTFGFYVPVNTTTVALAGSAMSSGTVNPGTAGNLQASLVYEAA